jgi:hypothetical protein
LKELGDEYVDGRDDRRFVEISGNNSQRYVLKGSISVERFPAWLSYFKILDTEEPENIFVEGWRHFKQVFIDRETDSKFDIVYDGNPDWKFLVKERETEEVAAYKRRLVCKHPMEWDKSLYKGINDEHFKSVIGAIDIWESISGKQIAGFSRNAFWFAHPVYFINHLNNAGLLGNSRVDELKQIQDMVVKLRSLTKGEGRGIYQEGSREDTYCNHAAFITIWAVDGNMTNFTDRKQGVFPEIPAKKKETYPYKISNHWCDVLETQAKEGKIVEFTGEVTAKEAAAQAKANKGYVVIAAWKNMKGKNDRNNSPHFATVRPGFEADPEKGPMLANVGATNDVMRRFDGFPGKPLDEIRWYYNPAQKFQYKPEVIEEYKKPEYEF